VVAVDSARKGHQGQDQEYHECCVHHAIRWAFVQNNPITVPVRGSGVRQSAKREQVPIVLDAAEFQRLLEELQLRERVLVWVSMTTGLRRGELAGLKWSHCSFEKLTINLPPSVGDQKVGKVKTEASKKPIPIDPHVAQDLLAWYRTTKYMRQDDYVFATDAARAGKQRGKQPLWLAKVMQYHIQPAAKRAGISKTIGWHTFRHSYTTLLHANGEDTKVVQELLRHGSAKVTIDVYAQAVTQAKRTAQGRVVSSLRSDDSPFRGCVPKMSPAEKAGLTVSH